MLHTNSTKTEENQIRDNSRKHCFVLDEHDQRKSHFSSGEFSQSKLKRMGKGGNMNLKNSEHDHLKRVPIDKPKFTLADLKKVIPPHCFQRSILRSYSYVATDLMFISIFYYLAATYIPVLDKPWSYLAWTAYWTVQGCVFTGVWVLAHECGHRAFTDYQILDDVTGLALHSTLLVPYFSWKYSHRRHHSNTGSIERDEVFVPKQKWKISTVTKYLSNNPIGRLMTLAFTLTLGWPLYLTFNVSGRPYDRFACHYDPYGPIYNDRERVQILISDIGLATALYVLYRVAMANGFVWLFCIYGVPLLICNGFLVLITYLQHTHPALPHYDGSEWDWLRGALATVDRDYGILNKVFHNITDTHVVHHLFSTMPHYHAMEATMAVKPILGEYYRLDETPFWKALWREAKECIYVEADEGSEKKGVLWYKNKF